jgi:hypothetical protein
MYTTTVIWDIPGSERDTEVEPDIGDAVSPTEVCGSEVAVLSPEVGGSGEGEVSVVRSTCSVYATEEPTIPLSLRGNTVTLWSPLLRPTNSTGVERSLLSFTTIPKLPGECSTTKYPAKLHETLRVFSRLGVTLH